MPLRSVDEQCGSEVLTRCSELSIRISTGGKHLREEKGEDLRGKGLRGERGGQDLNRERGEKILGGKGLRGEREGQDLNKERGEKILGRKRGKIAGGKKRPWGGGGGGRISTGKGGKRS